MPERLRSVLGRCVARLVDPSVRRVLAQAAFTAVDDAAEPGAPARVLAELRLTFPLDEVQDGWIEVVADKHWPVRSAKGHRIRRALRWADTALRAERAPAGLAPHSAREGLGRAGRRGLGALPARLGGRRPIAATPPWPPSAKPPWTPSPACPPPSGDPAYLAEVLGR